MYGENGGVTVKEVVAAIAIAFCVVSFAVMFVAFVTGLSALEGEVRQGILSKRAVWEFDTYCLDEVLYYRSGHMFAVALNQDSTVKRCKEI